MAVNLRITVPLPHWASRLAEGDYTIPGASLPTRDGRETGNAVTVGLVDSLNPKSTYLVVTDAGNQMKLTITELDELFHPPEFVMSSFLPAVKESLTDGKNIP